jgi:hypothetical protein
VARSALYRLNASCIRRLRRHRWRFHATVILREGHAHRLLLVRDAVVLTHGERGLRALTAEALFEDADSFDLRAVPTNQNDSVAVLADRVYGQEGSKEAVHDG